MESKTDIALTELNRTEWKDTKQIGVAVLTCRLYRQLPREVASISSAAASLMLIAAIICLISGELISIPCRPYMADAKSRIDMVSVHRVSFSVSAPISGRICDVVGWGGAQGERVRAVRH